MREVEPAPPRHQKFSSHRRHRVVDRDGGAILRQRLGRDQAGRACADDGGLDGGRSNSVPDQQTVVMPGQPFEERRRLGSPMIRASTSFLLWPWWMPGSSPGMTAQIKAR